MAGPGSTGPQGWPAVVSAVKHWRSLPECTLPVAAVSSSAKVCAGRSPGTIESPRAELPLSDGTQFPVPLPARAFTGMTKDGRFLVGILGDPATLTPADPSPAPTESPSPSPNVTVPWPLLRLWAAGARGPRAREHAAVASLVVRAAPAQPQRHSGGSTGASSKIETSKSRTRPGGRASKCSDARIVPKFGTRSRHPPYQVRSRAFKGGNKFNLGRQNASDRSYAILKWPNGRC
jgi:hypothetical protein